MWSAKPIAQMLASVEELCRKGALAVARYGPAIFVDGMANLITAELDRERLRQMLLALEAKQRLVELLTAYVDGRQQEVRVVVGLDEASPAMQDLVLIGAPARLGGANLGTVAVIAPTRIQYQEMIQAVRYIARLSERILGGPADPSNEVGRWSDAHLWQVSMGLGNLMPLVASLAI